MWISRLVRGVQSPGAGAGRHPWITGGTDMETIRFWILVTILFIIFVRFILSLP